MELNFLLKHIPSFILLGLEGLTDDRELALVSENVQQQQGSSDCGPFAVAYLVEVLSGGDVTSARFDQKRMRQHLADCIRVGKWSPFPKVTNITLQHHSDNDELPPASFLYTGMRI